MELLKQKSKIETENQTNDKTENKTKESKQGKENSPGPKPRLLVWLKTVGGTLHVAVHSGPVRYGRLKCCDLSSKYDLGLQPESDKRGTFL